LSRGKAQILKALGANGNETAGFGSKLCARGPPSRPQNARVIQSQRASAFSMLEWGVDADPSRSLLLRIVSQYLPSP
jgi:hypothetical protein